jgi:hypothetical protein
VSAVSVGIGSVTASDSESGCEAAKDTKSVKAIDQYSAANGLGSIQTCLSSISIAQACITARGLQNEIDPPTDLGTPSWVSSHFVSNNTPGECRQNREGSEMDAATHAYLSCRLIRAVGESIAMRILDSHEVDSPQDPCISHEQDLNNNEVGRQLANQVKTDPIKECTDLAFAALNNWRLQVNFPFPEGMCSWTGRGL